MGGHKTRSLASIHRTFENRLYVLSRENILDLNKQDKSGATNNVIVGLAQHCFSLIDWQGLKNDIGYQLIYVNGSKGLRGYALTLALSLKTRNELLMYFSEFLEQEFSDTKAFDTFNTYQHFLRTYLEKLGFFTYTDDLLKRIRGRSTTIWASGVRGLVYIPVIDFKDASKRRARRSRGNLDSVQQYVYVMINRQNGYYKIGRSRFPFFRERTLQAQEPDVQLIEKWEAPAHIEGMLHRKFHEKRKRGEWFTLSDSDIGTIREIMAPYPIVQS